MRVINTRTRTLERVADVDLDEDENKYAIISHRWGKAEEEVSFADVHGSLDFSHKQGFAKFKGFCDKAASLGYKYCWIDTCCT